MQNTHKMYELFYIFPNITLCYNYLLRLTEQNTAGDTDELTCEAFSIISNQCLYDFPALGSE